MRGDRHGTHGYDNTRGILQWGADASGDTMDLLIVRHARAEDPVCFAATRQPDAKRPLTAKGIRKMKKAACGLRSFVPSIDLLVSSPLRRAVQTAKIIADAYGGIEWVEREELSPGAAPRRLIAWLAAQRDKGTVCIVGHEPGLSDLLSILLDEESEQPAKLKKGSATLLTFEGRIAAREGHLQWHHSAKELASSA